jgi:hypothetical protein
MRHLKNFTSFFESYLIAVEYPEISISNLDLNESLNLFYENILKSIGAEESDLFKSFNLPEEEYKGKLSLDILSDNVEFINSLSSIGLKKSFLQSTDDLETFVNRPCRFLMIYRIEANELENPDYILFQSWNDTLSKWEDTKLYKISGDIKSFYDKLSSKVIEIEDNGDNFIYSTTNGNEWILQNPDKESEIYQKYFRKDDFEKLLNDRKVKINII